MGIYITIGLIGGSICAALAAGKQRNAVAWFVIGFCFPLFGILYIATLQDLRAAGMPAAGWSRSIATPAPPIAPSVPSAPAAPPAPGTSGSLEWLEGMRARGVMGQAEYDRRRADFLARYPAAAAA